MYFSRSSLTPLLVTLISDLINKMDALTQQLPKSIYKATDQDKIYHVVNNVHGMDKTEASTFIRRMDILFGNDCRGDDGHFRYISRGKYGMILVVQYLRSLEWKSAGIPFTIAAVKLTSIVSDMETLWYVVMLKANIQSMTAKHGSVTVEDVIDVDDEKDEDFHQPPTPNSSISLFALPSKMLINSIAADSESSDADSAASEAEAEPKKGKKNSASASASKRVVKDASRRRAKKKQKVSDPTELGPDGMLADIDVQPISDTSAPPKLPAAADITHFFGKPFTAKGTSGMDKLHRKCTLCSDRQISDLSTNRRHMEAYHAPEYRKWCKDNTFESKLPADVKARKAEAAEAKVLEQQTLDPHLQKKPERVVRYSDKLFRDAAIEWLIATDQVSHSFSSITHHSSDIS
ncbi:putative AC transposase [Favolaschia claudopus]|uniref:AC transposase n=1 Tax=Favolaschia claudopus TaxID=2862362 RepID=A0AAV9ZWY9_9AGAR